MTKSSLLGFTDYTTRKERLARRTIQAFIIVNMFAK